MKRSEDENNEIETTNNEENFSFSDEEAIIEASEIIENSKFFLLYCTWIFLNK